MLISFIDPVGWILPDIATLTKKIPWDRLGDEGPTSKLISIFPTSSFITWAKRSAFGNLISPCKPVPPVTQPNAVPGWLLLFWDCEVFIGPGILTNIFTWPSFAFWFEFPMGKSCWLIFHFIFFVNCVFFAVG